MSFYGFARALLYLPVKILYPTKYLGSADKVTEKKLVITANHRSLLDPVILGVHLKPHLHFMSKAELWDNRLLGRILNGLQAIPVHRGSADLNATKQALKVLKNNQVFAVFPEGTRNHTQDDLQEFKNGAAMIAIKTQSPIRVYYMAKKPRVFRKNYVVVGEEFTLDAFYGQKLTKETLDEATQVLEAEYRKLHEAYEAFCAQKRAKKKGKR